MTKNYVLILFILSLSLVFIKIELEKTKMFLLFAEVTIILPKIVPNVKSEMHKNIVSKIIDIKLNI